MKLALTLATAVLATAAFAKIDGDAGMRRPRDFGHSRNRVLEMAVNPKTAADIGITPEQAAKIKGFISHSEADRDLNVKLSELMKKQAEMMNAETIDEAAVLAQFDEIAKLRAEIEKNKLKKEIAAMKTLTPEQMTKARALIAERAAKRAKPQPKKPAPKAEEKKAEAAK